MALSDLLLAVAVFARFLHRYYISNSSGLNQVSAWLGQVSDDSIIFLVQTPSFF